MDADSGLFLNPAEMDFSKNLQSSRMSQSQDLDSLRANAEIISSDNFRSQCKTKTTSKTKVKRIDQDNKRSRQQLERVIEEMKRELANQKAIISSLSKSNANMIHPIQHANPNGFQATVSTYNHFENLMDDDASQLSGNDSNVHIEVITSNKASPKYALSFTPPKSTNPINAVMPKVAATNAPTSNKRTAPQDNVNQTSKKNKPSSPTASAKVHKPPPIVVSNLDCKNVSEILCEVIGKDAFYLRHVGKNTTNINTNNLKDFKSVLSILEDSNAQYHSFTPKEEQQTNIVLRHLHASYDASDITESLNELSLDIVVSKVMKLPNKTNNNLWLVQLEAGSNSKQLLDQKFLLHQRVVFERKQQSGIAQCKKCQLFGHSARNCKHNYRCVKCTDNHEPGMCPRTINPNMCTTTSPACVNCKADHPANFRGCPYYAKVIQRKQKQHQSQIKKTSIIQKPVPQSAPSVMRNESLSYAAALANGDQNYPSPPNPLEFLDTESKKYFNVDFSYLHSQFKQFYPKYMALADDKRAMALLGFTMSLSK